MKYNNHNILIEKALQKIISGGKRLSTMVTNLLDFSRIKNKDITLSKKLFNVKDCIDTVLHYYEHLYSHKKIRLTCSVDPQIPPIFGDKERIQQVLFNILGNALKYTKLGAVSITAALSLEPKSRNVIITISDSGIGIEEFRLKSLFSPISIDEDGTIHTVGKPGLGLSISKSIMELHEGSLHILSTPGQGTTVICNLPIDSVENLTTATVEPYATDLTASKIDADSVSIDADFNNPVTILAVDDDPINIRILENQLRAEFVTVATAEDGPEALSLIDSGLKPDIILLDIMMPQMSGYEVAQIVRQSYSLFKLPIIMLTAKDTINDLLTGFKAGANDYIRKPFNRYELTARINTQLILKKALNEKEQLINIEEDIEIAKQIQKNTISDLPDSNNFFSIASRFIPMKDVGGDYCGFHNIAKDKLGIFITDVNGHGIQAALIASMIKIIFSSLDPLAKTPSQFITEFNRIMMRNDESRVSRGNFPLSFSQNRT
jgi:two-component system sensor histidine kinase ChiS